MLASFDIRAKKSEIVSTLSAKFLYKFPTYPAGKLFLCSLFYIIYLLEAEKKQIQTFFVIKHLSN